MPLSRYRSAHKVTLLFSTVANLLQPPSSYQGIVICMQAQSHPNYWLYELGQAMPPQLSFRQNTKIDFSNHFPIRRSFAALQIVGPCLEHWIAVAAIL